MSKNNMHELDFKPLPFLKSGHCQTILGSFGLPMRDPPSKNLMIELADSDRLCCPIFTPENWNEKKEIVVMLHGLGGSDKSRYMRRITSHLYSKGYLIFCMNRRGCGRGAGLSKRLPHGGLTGDILHVLKKLRQDYPLAPIQLVGFSIGGNLLLKLLGELGDEAHEYVNHGIAVSPTVDLKDTAETLATPSKWLYNRYYINGLIDLVNKSQAAFPNEKKVKFPKNCTSIDYDGLYVAPKWGYKNAYDYYAQNSSNQFIPNITVPCDLLYAEDDPFIRHETIESLKAPSSLTIWKTKHGGHMGFLGPADNGRSIRWMDRQVIQWIEKKWHTPNVIQN